jgi:histone H3/H4
MEETAMPEEPLIAKLTQNLHAAQESLRIQLVAKVEELAAHPRALVGEELREELENFVEEFLSQFAATYAEFISTVEEEMPARKAPKPRKKTAKKPPGETGEPEKPAFVKPTFVQRAFNAEGLRVAKEARPALMDALNEAIQHDIDRIKEQLPKFSRGAKEGEKSRVTIKAEDVAEARSSTTRGESASPANGLGQTDSDLSKELDAVALDSVDPRYELAVVLRTCRAGKQKQAGEKPEGDA